MSTKAIEMPPAWRAAHRARGLAECQACGGTGMAMNEAVLEALDLANDGKPVPALEETYCKRCDGLGWVRPLGPDV